MQEIIASHFDLLIAGVVLIATFLVLCHRVAGRTAVANEMIKKHEALFSSIFHRNCAIMILVDPRTGQLQDVNDEALRFYGYTREEMLRLKISDLNTLPPAEVKAQMVLARGRGQNHFFFRHRLKNNEIRDVEVFSTPLEVDGETYLNSIVHDITEAKRLERERAEAQAHLLHSSKLASIGTLAAGVAHEINNPLAVLRADLSIIKNELIGDEYLALFDRHERAVDRIAKIVQGMRTFASEDNDVLTAVDMMQVIERTLALIGPTLRESGIEVTTRSSCAGRRVKGNVGKLQQVVMNVLSNSRDALDGIANASIDLMLCESGEWLELRVSDNGHGISEQNLSRIFDPFFTTKPPGSGTGLGLSLCSSILHSLGGEISVESGEGAGTVVTVRLRIADQQLKT